MDLLYMNNILKAASSSMLYIYLFLLPELPAGKLVEFLVGFTNNGDKDFILDAIDASFRYPMDFNFYIQNFTAIPYNRAVKPRQEATVMYSFYPAEAFAARPLGLTVNLAYHDAVSSYNCCYSHINLNVISHSK